MATGQAKSPDFMRSGFVGFTPGDHLSNMSFNPLEWEVAGISPTQLRTTGSATITPHLLDYVVAFDFGFAIPGSAVILGVFTLMNWQSQSATVAVLQNVSLFKSSVIFGTTKTPNSAVLTVPTDSYLGGEWGTVITPADVNDPTFGFGIQIFIDTIRVFLNMFSVCVAYSYGGQTFLNIQTFKRTRRGRAQSFAAAIPPGASMAIPFVSPIDLMGATITAGFGSPEGVVTANVGSEYHRLDGGPGTTIYIKESGSGNTGWVAK